VKYQDRILFGKDSFQPEEYPYYWRVFETKDDYFDYYRPYHAFWKLYGIDLPDGVLKKVYFQNALKITKGIPQGGWPRETRPRPFHQHEGVCRRQRRALRRSRFALPRPRNCPTASVCRVNRSEKARRSTRNS